MESIGSARIMFIEMLPVVSATVIVYATLLIPSSIAFEATLSFLGLGVPPPTPTWGNMLGDAMAYYKVAWWLLLFPGAALLGITFRSFRYRLEKLGLDDGRED